MPGSANGTATRLASADSWTLIFANDASTSDDDVFGNFGDC
jgi:hypothetical protein